MSAKKSWGSLSIYQNPAPRFKAINHWIENRHLRIRVRWFAPNSRKSKANRSQSFDEKENTHSSICYIINRLRCHLLPIFLQKIILGICGKNPCCWTVQCHLWIGSNHWRIARNDQIFNHWRPAAIQPRKCPCFLPKRFWAGSWCEGGKTWINRQRGAHCQRFWIWIECDPVPTWREKGWIAVFFWRSIGAVKKYHHRYHQIDINQDWKTRAESIHLYG